MAGSHWDTNSGRGFSLLRAGAARGVGRYHAQPWLSGRGYSRDSGGEFQARISGSGKEINGALFRGRMTMTSGNPGSFGFGLSAEQEARAAWLHKDSIVVNLLS